MKKLVETQELESSPSLECKSTIIDNISLSYNLVEYCLPILQEKRNKNCYKRSHYVKDAEFRTKEAPSIYCQIFINNFFLLSKWILKYKIINNSEPKCQT
jgi:hypothetical protein